jgi:GT2 family glycosyltransferase
MPRFSVITPVYETPIPILRACLDSVLAQTLGDWEMCLVDDASPSEVVRATLAEYAAADPRFKVAHRLVNGGIVAATDDAFALATGEFLVLLDHDDLVEPHALAEVAAVADAHPDLDYCYSDEDHLTAAGIPWNPFYKPDWSPERFRSQMYTCHLSVLRRSLVEEVGGMRPGFDGAQDYDLVLRVTERARYIHHIPEVLYHWRELETSTAAGNTKPYAWDAGRRAVQEHCDRAGIDAVVEAVEHPLGTYRLHRRVHGEPLVSIVIPTRGTARRVWGVTRTLVVDAVRGVMERSTYRNVEIVVVADRATPASTVARLRDVAGDRLRLVWWDRPFNFAEQVNWGAAHATGEYLLFLNDDVEVVTPGWVEEMLGIAQEPDVGVVGAKLLFADGRLQHGGHVYAGSPRHIFFLQDGEELGPFALLRVTRECSGVTAACALVPTDVFEEVGGFCPELPNNFNDVDFSLKVRSKGYRIVWTPHAVLYHFESMSREPRVSEEEHAYLDRRWLPQLNADPYYNPNLEPDRDDWWPRVGLPAWVAGKP